MEKLKKDWKSTAEIPVSKKLIGQIIGQDKSVEIVKKAAAQKRNVLLVGLPGTGKSLLAQAMAEILPLSRLQDVLVYPNPSDFNNPKVGTTRAGEGKKIVQKARLDAQKGDDNMRLLGFLLPIGWFILAWVFWWLGWYSDIVFAAFIILGGFLLIGMAVGTQMRAKESKRTPKLLIDNSGKKIAPFFEGTGARAGSLLGDVRHDPLQCHLGFNNLYIQKAKSLVKKPFAELWSEMYEKYGKEIIRNEKGHEALMLPPEEKIYTLGYKDGKVVLSRILSLNRQPFNGELIELKAGDKTISLTPEHKVFTQFKSKKAEKIGFFDRLLKLEIKEKLLAAVRP